MRGLALTDRELVATREVCVAAHGGLLEAHLLQAEARKALTAAAEGGEARLVHAEQAQASLDGSTKALAGARQALDRCREHTRKLMTGRASR
jgi:hypothetical protein